MPERFVIVLLSHGAADRMEDIEPYYRHIRGDQPAVPAVLEALRQHYREIGGRSPLNAITQATAAALEEVLVRQHGVGSFRVFYGFRHTPPFAETVMSEAGSQTERGVLAIPLAPHVSRFTELGYQKALAAARAEAPDRVPVALSGPWHLEPDLVEFWAKSVHRAIDRLFPEARAAPKVLFTAHSLPERMLKGSPYPGQLAEGARAIAERAGIPPERFETCWQSASPAGDEGWAGPDLLEVLPRIAAQGSRGVVVVPHGFVSEHLEVLYDLDIRAKKAAEDLGLGYARAEMPNASPLLVSALASVVEATVSGRRGGPFTVDQASLPQEPLRSTHPGSL